MFRIETWLFQLKFWNIPIAYCKISIIQSFTTQRQMISYSVISTQNMLTYLILLFFHCVLIYKLWNKKKFYELKFIGAMVATSNATLWLSTLFKHWKQIGFYNRRAFT